jgi:antitoxin MazE
MSDFISIQSRGTFSLPAAICRRYRLDEPGAQVEVIDADGEIILRPKVALDVAQAWFWEPDWQAGEREAEDQRIGGERTDSATGEELLESLDSTS